ncbi:hypothetical protein F3Y22_tig00012523pilonHSYRG00028 [Hibiscus syriacus]|uniref:Pentatricopeptide repeat-containing protein n=1 Tax=Hibiscus syriacus TaxID=106335 RepID=A0A6A3C853_HIBSY|nr:hypothetical protein F3Y22_tig00012523pilonHSYRG00028 [Hibiscus syriacus]
MTTISCFESLGTEVSMKKRERFQSAVGRERRRNEQGKLGSAMISILGRLGKVELANAIFDTALREGYGNTAYAKAGRCCDSFEDASMLFEELRLIDNRSCRCCMVKRIIRHPEVASSSR